MTMTTMTMGTIIAANKLSTTTTTTTTGTTTRMTTTTTTTTQSLTWEQHNRRTSSSRNSNCTRLISRSRSSSSRSWSSCHKKKINSRNYNNNPSLISNSCESLSLNQTVPSHRRRRIGMSINFTFPTTTTSSILRISNIPVIIILIIISLVTPSFTKLHHTKSDSSLFNTIPNIEKDEESISLHRQIEPQVLQRLESQFLKLFNMERRPVRRKGENIKVPKYLIDLYESQSGLTLFTSNLNLPGRHTRTANTVRTFYDDSQRPDSPNQSHHHIHLDLTSIPSGEEVTGAELRIPFHIITRPKLINNSNNNNNNISESDNRTIKNSSSDNDSGSVTKDNNHNTPNKIRVIVSDVTKKIKKKLEPIMYAIDTKVIDLKKKRKSNDVWLTMDVFPAVARWLKDSKKNHGLVVQIFDAMTGELISEKWENKEKQLRLKRSLPGTSENLSETPVLFTYSDDGLHKRKTRDAPTLSRHYRNANDNKNKKIQQKIRNKGQRNKGRKRNLCARHKMFVDFTDVSWNDWIVAPPGYEAHHCAGECPFPMAEHLNATNHAVIQALVNSMNPQYVPPPCCVPTKYSSLSLLYTDAADKIVLKNYHEMVVDSCGCS